VFDFALYAFAVRAVDADSDSVVPSSGEGEAQFTTTHWSVVLVAGGRTSPQADEALSPLLHYWYAYAFATARL
jgi:hypothetical protein